MNMNKKVVRGYAMDPKQIAWLEARAQEISKVTGERPSISAALRAIVHEAMVTHQANTAAAKVK